MVDHAQSTTGVCRDRCATVSPDSIFKSRKVHCPKCRASYPADHFRALDRCLACGHSFRRFYYAAVAVSTALLMDAISLAYVTKLLNSRDAILSAGLALGWGALAILFDCLLRRFSDLPRYRSHSISGWLSFWIFVLVALPLRSAIIALTQ